MLNNTFNRFARGISRTLGHPAAFSVAVLAVVAWAICGPLFDYSASWQLVINTGTTIATFLMVFILQNAQNRDARALQVKLDELIRAAGGARNELIDIENFSEEELERYCAEFSLMHRRYAEALNAKQKEKPAAGGEQPATRSNEGA
jgi:low affinity Fe/Cu permease